MIDKRKLRFVQITPAEGMCQYCNKRFSGSEEEIRQQFHTHKCERQQGPLGEEWRSSSGPSTEDS